MKLNEITPAFTINGKSDYKFNINDNVKIIFGPLKGERGIIINKKKIGIHHRWNTTNNIYSVSLNNRTEEFGEDELESTK